MEDERRPSHEGSSAVPSMRGRLLRRAHPGLTRGEARVPRVEVRVALEVEAAVNDAELDGRADRDVDDRVVRSEDPLLALELRVEDRREAVEVLRAGLDARRVGRA